MPFEGKTGIFCCRRPGETRRRIISVALKYFPHVSGDGPRALRELTLGDPRAGPLSHLYCKRHTAWLGGMPARSGRPEGCVLPIHLFAPAATGNGPLRRFNRQVIDQALDLVAAHQMHGVPTGAAFGKALGTVAHEGAQRRQPVDAVQLSPTREAS